MSYTYKTYTDAELNNYNNDYVYCIECGAKIDFRNKKIHKKQEQGEEYANDGSLVPTYSFTCNNCYGGVPYHGNTKLSLIDIERKVDNLQKNLDNLHESLQKTLDIIKKQNAIKKKYYAKSKIFNLIKIIFIIFIYPFLCLLFIYLHLSVVLDK